MADTNAKDLTPNDTAKEPVENRREDGTFGPGNIANPNGRPPKGHSITETIRAMMDEKPEIKKALGAKILQHAMEGDPTAMRLIWNYLDGMPRQEIDNKHSGSITINKTTYDGDSDSA